MQLILLQMEIFKFLIEIFMRLPLKILLFQFQFTLGQVYLSLIPFTRLTDESSVLNLFQTLTTTTTFLSYFCITT